MTEGRDGVELWRTSVLNGTTEQVADHLSGSSSSNPGSYMSRVIGDVLYFDCRRSSGATQELHAYSPSNNPTWLVADVYPSAGQSGNPGNRMSIVVEDLLFFSAFSRMARNSGHIIRPTGALGRWVTSEQEPHPPNRDDTGTLWSESISISALMAGQATNCGPCMSSPMSRTEPAPTASGNSLN